MATNNLTNDERLRKGLIKLLGVSDSKNPFGFVKETAYVASSCLSEVSYNATLSILTVVFVESGSRYSYYGVPESEYESLVTTLGSVGEQFNDDIKGSYPYLRIG